MMGKLAPRACLMLVLVTTQGIAQTQPPVPSPSGPTRPVQRPPAPAPGVATGCIYANMQYSLGAAMCLSAQLWQLCTTPDSTHSAQWIAVPQPLCSGAAPAPSPSKGDIPLRSQPPQRE
jgi:hypothetical protein